MCTVTWVESAEGLEIFFNRDEQRTRMPAEPPRVYTEQGIHYLAAIDGNAGGTWLAANEHGLAVAILNHYEAQMKVAAGDFASRGRLVTHLMACHSADEVAEHLSLEQAKRYRGFILLVFQPGNPVSQFTWNGLELKKETRPAHLQVLSTSSVKTEEVLAYRYAEYQRQVLDLPQPDRAAHIAYQHSRHPSDSAFSVRMAREDARTVSFSHLVLGPTISYAYADDEQDVRESLNTKNAVGR